MSVSAEAVSGGVRARSYRYFLLRRLHSLTGIVPVGLYFVEHLIGNSTAIFGPEAFNDYARFLHSIPYGKFFLEALIIIPLAFHAIFGIFIAREAKFNVDAYNYERNWAFTLQRVTGYIAFAFIIYHVWALRLNSGIIDNPDIAYDTVHEHLQAPWVFAFYLLGVVSITFHFANGLWSFAITWGITTGRRAQQVWRTCCLVGIFPILTLVGLRALWAFV